MYSNRWRSGIVSYCTHSCSDIGRSCTILSPRKDRWSLHVPPGLTFSNSTFCPHSVFMCFLWIWEQTAIISLYSINWLVFITETECVYCAVRTGSLYIILRSAHTVYLCVLCGSENKQRLFFYTTLTDWFYNRDGVCLLRGRDWIFIYNSTFCPHSVFVCFVWIWEQTAIISLYSINWLVFITKTKCVYCAVRTGSLYIILRSAHTVYLCVLCGSQNKQRLFPYTALTAWFL